MLSSTIQNFFFVLVDITFNESESYFPIPYFQGVNFVEEDKDQNSYFIDSFLINPLKVSGLAFDLVSVTLSLNLSHCPLSLLLRIKRLAKCTQGRKL